MGKLPLSHRSTKYPCFVPNLGESLGAGRRGLTHGKINKNLIFWKRKLHSWRIRLRFSPKITFYPYCIHPLERNNRKLQDQLI